MLIKTMDIEPGTVLPNRLYVRNIKFADNCTFRGQILWKEDYGITMGTGGIRWDICLKFDSSFMCLVGGYVRSFRSDHTVASSTRYNVDVVYTNAGLFSHFHSLANNSYFFEVLIPRVRREGASCKTLEQLSKVFEAASNPLFEDPGDYNLM